MERKATAWSAIVGTTLLAVAVFAASASAVDLRNPQVVFNDTDLQSYFTSVPENINVATDQVNAQVWTSTVSGNSTFTLMLELAGYAGQNAIGVYNGDAASPTLYQVFPGYASPGWFAVASFRANGTLIVNLFDENAVGQGTTSYTGVDRNKFGYYLQSPAGTLFTQDYRNPSGYPQALAYAGTGINAGSWWLCWEDLPWLSADRDFNDAVLFLESVNPTPVRQDSWGALKARYH